MSSNFFDFAPNDPIADLPTEKLERAMTLRNGLVALCEGRNNMNDAVYRLLRREFMVDPLTSDLLPRFVRAAQDTGTMWAFLKDHSPQWAPRRQFVREQFVALIDTLESMPTFASGVTFEVTNDLVRTNAREKPMYNLFVNGNQEGWQGEPWTIEEDRCINAYTEKSIIDQYGSLDEASVEALKKLPCIFAYEKGNRLNPKFGIIKDVVRRQRQVRVEYQLIAVSPFLSHADLNDLSFELDIGNMEMNRTHWAVKGVDLAKELSVKGFSLPHWTGSVFKSVDISKHQFEVALSFPGEIRPLVSEVAGHLERLIGPNTYFYDNNYVSQLARPSLDSFLQSIYRNQAKLIVVFLSADYQSKNWCGIEFRAVRDIIAERKNDKIMFIRTDDGVVEGVFAIDGYVDARRHSAAALAGFIRERVQLL
jgi:TIR domain